MHNGKLRAGLIGVGSISEWHARALRIAGFDITAVSTRPDSTRLKDFAERHKIPLVFDHWKSMLAHPEHWDALVIATHTDGTPDVLSEALRLNIPILVEKPVAWTSAQIAELCSVAHERVIVGYNRRFYRPVREARREVMLGPPLLAHLSLPEAISSAGGRSVDGYLRPFFENSCHGIDLARFVLGDLEIEAVNHVKTENGQISSFAATLSTSRGDILEILGNWGTPANFALNLHRPGRRFELRPFEVATIYEGMEVLQPSETFPIRRYRPRQTGRVALEEIDLREKPGFVSQAGALRSLVKGDPLSFDVATLDDALAALSLCEKLARVELDSDRPWASLS